ncbi:MAG: hypothetical protein ACYTCU_08060, partial [Planctomycetota bacterium]
MRRHRSLLSISLSLVALATLPFLPDPPPVADPAPTGPGPGALACNPLAPFDVILQSSDRVAGQVVVELAIAPLRPLTDVRWRLDLSGTASVLQGETSGELGSGSGSATIRLLVPEDGSHKTAELVLQGIMQGSDGSGVRYDEPVALSSMLEWDRPASFAPRATVGNALTGESHDVAVVPSSWTTASAGRPPGVPTHGASGQAADGSGSFLVTGTFLYEDKEWGWAGWTGADPLLPIRRADVTVLDDVTGNVLGSGSTDQNGAFAISCSAVGPVDVVVMCECDTSFDTGFQRIRVTPYSAIDYAAFGPVFSGHDPSTDLDVGTVTALKMLASGKEANPFNIFDVSVDAWEYLMGPDHVAGPATDDIQNIWPTGAKTWATPTGGRIGDNHGYDDATILHELGHTVHFLYSDLDSAGLPHSFGDSDQDPRTALDEGFATFFTGMVFANIGREPMYVDSSGSAQTGGVQLRMRLETAQPYTTDAKGAADEVAVGCALYDLHDDTLTPDKTPGVDDDPFDGSVLVDGKTVTVAFWEVFTGPMADAFQLSHGHTWDGWLSLHAADPQYDLLKAVFTSFGQDFFEDAQEPDDSLFLAAPTPPSPTPVWLGPFTLYRTDDMSLAPGSGDSDWFAHDLVKGSVVSFQTRYPNNAADADTQVDPVIEIFGPLNEVVAYDFDSAVGRNAKIANFVVPQTGTWTSRIGSQTPQFRRYGKYEYRVLYVFENHLPTIDSAPIASPTTIKDDETSQLSATASDEDAGQVLSYAWTPLDGGSIVGTGAAVSFVPPTVAAPTTVGVQLTVLDDLGAASDPVVVQLLVNPSVGG